MIKKRNAYFDNMKAMLIFLVVLGHVLSNFVECFTFSRYDLAFVKRSHSGVPEQISIQKKADPGIEIP